MAKLFDTGAVSQNADGWLVLNPTAPFKLHVDGLSIDQATKLKRALDKGYALVRDAEQPALNVIYKAKEFRCREIESVVDRLGPVFRESVQAKIDGMPDWQRLVEKGDAAASKRARLFWDFQKAATAECGEAFRAFPSLLADDPDERRRGVVELLCFTYVRAGFAAHHASQRTQLRSIQGWSFNRPNGGCCPDCRSVAEWHPPERCPLIPQHAGCSCDVHPIRR